MRNWPSTGVPRFNIARWSENELVLFDESRRESWLIYPPRSRYEFLRRQTPDTTLVMHHPWAPYSREVEHAIRYKRGAPSTGLPARRRRRSRRRLIQGSIHFVDRQSPTKRSPC